MKTINVTRRWILEKYITGELQKGVKDEDYVLDLLQAIDYGVSPGAIVISFGTDIRIVIAG